jgi:hypothetical protein
MMVALVPIMVVWSLANPMFASPDESSHLVRAQGFARLSVTAPFPTDGLPLGAAECFATQPNTTADCMDLTWADNGTDVSLDSLSNYPPLLHAIAAPATLAGSGLTNAYIVRIWVAVVAAGLLAWAGVLTTGRGSGPWPITGLLIAITPMVVFTSATVNPSGITAGFAALGVAAVTMPKLRGESLARHWPALATAVVGLVLTRRDGVLWIGVVAIAMLVLAAPDRAQRQRLRQKLPTPVMLAAAAGCVIVAAVAVAALASRFSRWRSGGGSTLADSIRLIRRFFLDIIGNFGWLDAQLPPETFAVALIVVGFVVLLSIAASPARWVFATVVLLGLLVASMVLLETQRSMYLQGRYLFPVWMALVMVAATGIAAGGLPQRITNRAVPVVLGLWAVIHVVGFTHNLRRYAIGQDGPWTFITGSSAWQPPMMSNAVAVVAFIVAMGVTVIAVTALVRPLCATASNQAQETTLVANP